MTTDIATDIACAVCGATEVSRRYRLPKFAVLQCEDCRTVFTSLRPARGELEAMYAEDYYSTRHAYYLGNSVICPETRRDENTRAFDELLDGIDHRRRGGRLLDVGCGIGVFLALARMRGWNVQGVEISAFAAQEARTRLGLSVATGTLAEAALPDASFDVVTLLDVFEHMPNPRAELREVFRVLRPGGMLMLDTPNADAFLRQLADVIYRCSAGAVTYPVRKLYHEFHLFYYSDPVLRRLLGEAGFRVDSVKGRPIPLPKARGNVIEKCIVSGLSRLERELDRPYELIVMARRPSAPERM